MSAYMVGRETIDTIVCAAVDHQIIQTVHASDLGRALVAANLDSIHARYPDTIGNNHAVPSDGDWETPYTYRGSSRPYTEGEIAKAVSVYTYNACESKDLDLEDSAIGNVLWLVRHPLTAAS